MSMEKKSVGNRPMPAPNFYLKVNLGCCQACPRKAKEKLEKLQGVVAVTVDREQSLVGVSGTVNPQILILKFARWGKKAELWSAGNVNTLKNSHVNSQKDQKNNTTSDTKEDKGPKNDDHDSDKNPSKRHHNDSTISWEHPDLVSNKRAVAAVSIRKSKKSGWLMRLFCKRKDQEGQLLGFNPAFKPNRLASKMPMHGLGGPRPGPFPQPYWNRPLHHYGSQYYRPMAYGKPVQKTPFPYHQPPIPPYGSLRSGPPPPPPQFNPMVHYTRYEDNYYG